MPKHFFVTGLPRSGTAWMATFLSGCPGVSCPHEALRHLSRIAELPEALATGAPFSGTADTGIPLFLDEIEEMFPGAAWILLDRAETASRASVAAFFESSPVPELYEAVRAPLARIREKALVVPFEELTSPGWAERVLWHIAVQPNTAAMIPWESWHRHMKDLRVSVRREAYETLRTDTEMARQVIDRIRKEAA